MTEETAMLRSLYVVMMALSISGLALSPTAAFANSSNPPCGAFDCTTTGTHGGSTNTCTPGTSGCNTTTTTKSNPAGNNQTQTCSGPDSQCTK
jgi:hypothetical protein